MDLGHDNEEKERDRRPKSMTNLRSNGREAAKKANDGSPVGVNNVEFMK